MITPTQADAIRTIIERAAERDPAVQAILDRLTAGAQARLDAERAA